MAGRIHFSSGKTLDITEMEFQNISPKLNAKGIKTQKTKSGHQIPLNSMTMEFIEHVPEVEDKDVTGDPVITKKKPVVVEPIIPEQNVQREKPKPKTNDERMAEMTEKSNCLHPADKLELYIQHTARGVRYFPVCSFCGFRLKYVSERKIVNGDYAGTINEKWTEADVANAKPWIEK